MKVIVYKNDEKIEFEIDECYKYIIDCSNIFYWGGFYIGLSKGSKNGHIMKTGKNLLLHRLIYMIHHGVELGEDDVIDHVDRNKMNNCVSNLRKITQYENALNRELREDQIYYNIYYCKYNNDFVFRYRKYKICRKFLNLQSALNFFDYIDKKYDHELSKHIHNFIPTSSIKNIWLKPYDKKCHICDATFWAKSGYVSHMKKCDGNLRKINLKTLERSKIILTEFT